MNYVIIEMGMLKRRISVPDGLLVESKLYDKVFEKICNTTVTIRKYDRSFFCITSIDYEWFEDDYYDDDLNNLFDSLQLRNSDIFYHIKLMNGVIRDPINKSQSKLDFKIID
jgi:hypothetical protein